MYVIPGFRISLVREPGVNIADRPLLDNPHRAACAFRAYFGEQDREHFAVLMLSVRHRFIGLSTVAIGCLTSCLVHPREVFKPAILGSAASIVLGHNHPSGDPEPSAEDIALTRRLASAGELLGISVLDHVVIGETKYVSFKERGLL